MNAGFAHRWIRIEKSVFICVHPYPLFRVPHSAIERFQVQGSKLRNRPCPFAMRHALCEFPLSARSARAAARFLPAPALSFRVPRSPFHVGGWLLTPGS
jgi:hypothetical protein